MDGRAARALLRLRPARADAGVLSSAPQEGRAARAAHVSTRPPTPGGRPSRRPRIHMTLLISGPGTSLLDRPSGVAAQMFPLRPGSRAPARDAHAKRCVGVTDRGHEVRRARGQAGRAAGYYGAESWAVAERTEHPRTRYLSDPDPRWPRFWRAGTAPRCACSAAGDAAARPREPRRGAKGGGAAQKARGPLDERRPRPSSRRRPVEEDLLDTDSVKAHRAALNAYNRLCGRIYVEAPRTRRVRAVRRSAVAVRRLPRRGKCMRDGAGLTGDEVVEVSRKSTDQQGRAGAETTKVP